MNELTTFHYGPANLDVRTAHCSGDIWFVATDVAKGLEYRDAANALRLLDDDERSTQIVSTPSGNQELSIISEPGLYKLIARSRKPAAKAFDRWVRHEVLPTIRKTGGYGTNTELLERIKHLEAIVASIAQGTIPNIAEYVTVRELLNDAHCRQQGRNKINRKICYWLGKLVPEEERLPRRNRGAWAYPRAIAKKFMREIGNQWVRDHNAGMRPTEVDLRQHTLKFS